MCAQLGEGAIEHGPVDQLHGRSWQAQPGIDPQLQRHLCLGAGVGEDPRAVEGAKVALEICAADPVRLVVVVAQDVAHGLDRRVQHVLDVPPATMLVAREHADVLQPRLPLGEALEVRQSREALLRAGAYLDAAGRVVGSHPRMVRA